MPDFVLALTLNCSSALPEWLSYYLLWPHDECCSECILLKAYCNKTVLKRWSLKVLNYKAVLFQLSFHKGRESEPKKNVVLLQERKGWKVIPESLERETKNFEVHETVCRPQKSKSHDRQCHIAFGYRMRHYNLLSYYECYSSQGWLKILFPLRSIQFSPIKTPNYRWNPSCTAIFRIFHYWEILNKFQNKT